MLDINSYKYKIHLGNMLTKNIKFMYNSVKIPEERQICLEIFACESWFYMISIDCEIVGKLVEQKSDELLFKLFM